MKKLSGLAALALLSAFCLLKFSDKEPRNLRDAPAQSFDGSQSAGDSQVPSMQEAFHEFQNHGITTAPMLQGQSEEVDLSGQFPPGKIPDQGAIGSCHDFSSIALLEAAFYRYYKTHVPFSETDLFAQTKMCSSEVCNNASVYKAIDGSMQCGLGEGGLPSKDIEFILEHGILTADGGSCASYAQFKKNYIQRFQKPLEHALLKLNSCGRSLPRVEPGKLKNTIDRWEKASPEAQTERDAVKEALSGFAVRKVIAESKLINGDVLLRISPERCEEMGKKQREALLSQLDAGRPVSVSVQLLGLKFWHPERRPTEHPDSTANHAFLIIGYRKDEQGRLRFQTRNSWVKDGKPYNPIVSSDELCHVMGITTLLTPDEARQGGS